MKELPEIVRAAYPWTGQTLGVDGGRMHYLDEGPKDAPVLLALHGNPTWSFYWRALIRKFAGEYRVVVPDHIGCGRSDKPQDWPYRLGDHVGNVVRLIEHLDLRDITFVVHDWGGAIGMGAASEVPERARRFVVTNTAAFRSQAIPPSIASCRIPVFGAVAVRGFNGFARVATIRATSKSLSREAKAGLLFPYDSWANRIATLRFVEDIPLKPSHPSYAALKATEDRLAQFVDHPMLLVWGEDDFCFTPQFRLEWEQRFPKARSVPLQGVGHYVMEDATERFLQETAAFLAANPLAEETP